MTPFFSHSFVMLRGGDFGTRSLSNFFSGENDTFDDVEMKLALTKPTIFFLAGGHLEFPLRTTS